jgi:glycosyltransferase involved in cell wall biosynthesis
MSILNSTKNNNILLVANYESDVGYAWWLIENFWSAIAKAFHQDRKCYLIYPVIHQIPNIIENAPIEIIKHNYADRSIKNLREFSSIIRSKNIGIVYLTDKPYYDWIYLVLRGFGVKKIFNHDHMPGEREELSFLKRTIKKTIHSFKIFSCDYYIGVSKFVMNRLVGVACAPVAKCTYILNGIKLFDNTKTNYAHEQFGFPKHAKIVVTTGRATFYKGIDQLIQAAHIILSKQVFEDLYFLHIGSGPDLEQFKKMVVELKVNHRFKFTGFRNDVIKILPSCDIGIQLSLGEAFSLSILEYLCAGLATLAPDNCGNTEAIENGVNGLLFEPGNIEDIANKITYLLKNSDFSNILGINGRKSVEENFTIERCNKELISLLERQFV